MGGGRVQFGGRIGFDGYVPAELDVTARGEDMHLRVPEGVRSVVDADLSLRGNFKAPTLGGTVTVKSALWNRRVDTPGSIFDLASRRSGGGGGAARRRPSAAPTVPLKFDIQLLMPSTLRVENNLARMVASADLTLRGTYDRPVITGHADIERGEVTFEGRRYRITHGTMDFTNPTRIEPFFDVEAETNVRVPGQTYRVTVGVCRHQRAAAADAQLRSAAADRRRARAAVQRRARAPAPATSRRSCARCRTRTRRRPTSSRRARRRRSPAACRPKSARWSSRLSASTPSS